MKAEAAQKRVTEYQKKSREENETHEVDPAARTDGCANNNNNNIEFEQQQQEESLLRKTVKYLMTLEREKTEMLSEGAQEVVEVAEAEMNEGEVEWQTEGETQFEEG